MQGPTDLPSPPAFTSCPPPPPPPPLGDVPLQAVVFASPQLSQRLSSSAEGRWLKGAWTRVVGVVGLATAVQVSCSCSQGSVQV